MFGKYKDSVQAFGTISSSQSKFYEMLPVLCSKNIFGCVVVHLTGKGMVKNGGEMRGGGSELLPPVLRVMRAPKK